MTRDSFAGKLEARQIFGRDPSPQALMSINTITAVHKSPFDLLMIEMDFSDSY